MTNSLKLTALPPETLVKLLKQAGCRTMSAEVLTSDIEAGAPKNDDGTINLIEYAAWLASENDKSTFLEVMSTAKPHGMTESGDPEKYPEPRSGPELRERRVATFWGNENGGDNGIESE